MNGGAASRAAVAGGKSRASARLGLTLRTILLNPRDGFEAAVEASERRQRTGEGGAEVIAPILLGAAAGAGAMLLWLKVGALAGVRNVTVADYSWNLLLAAALIGVALSVAAQTLWGWTGASLLTALGGRARRVDLRFVWGAAAFPLAVGPLVLLPLDLAIAGPAVFTAQRLADPVTMAWAALSIAVSAAAAAWSAWLFVRGVEVMAGVDLARALIATVAAVACVVVLASVSLAAVKVGA